MYVKHSTHTVVIIAHYKRMGYVIIPKPNCSRILTCLFFVVLAQYVAAVIAVVAVQVAAVPTDSWRSIVIADSVV